MPSRWEEWCAAVIRPPRARYSPGHLGATTFVLGGVKIQRHDFDVSNDRGHTLKCSHFRPAATAPEEEARPVVVYCHGNCGCRLDALGAVELLLPHGIDVLAFDFSGSGLSGGEFVSLGFFEQQDLQAVVAHLRAVSPAVRVGLWGRSMGAATSVLYAGSDPDIRAVVADSPFYSLEAQMADYTKAQLSCVPRVAIRLGIAAGMRRKIRRRAHFSTKAVVPADAARTCRAPLLLGHALGDDFITPRHSERILANHPGDKQLITFAGDHASDRPPMFRDAVRDFFRQHLTAPADAPPAAADPAGVG